MGGADIMVVAGEASGDQHAADLVGQLQLRRPDFHFFGMGGPRLMEKHVDLIYGSHEISVMGFSEVLPKIPRILAVLKGLATAAARRRPICAILVDIPDFNLRLARQLKRIGIPVVYYISPMFWAWRPNRLETIAAYVDLMLCILPFEQDLYRRGGISAVYVGNPVLDQVPPPAPTEHFRRMLGISGEGRVLGILPGSRATEVSRILPDVLGAVEVLQRDEPSLRVVLPLAPMLNASLVERHFSRSSVKVTVIEGQASTVLGASDASIVASGTATLEAALMARPFVVVYRVSLVNEVIGRALLRVRHVSLVNLLAGRAVVCELLQRNLNPRRLSEEVKGLLEPRKSDEMVSQLNEIRRLLGEPGASARAAEEVLRFLRGHGIES